MTNQELADSLKSAALAIGEKAVVAALLAEFPFLANPICEELLKLLVDKILETAINATEMGAFFLYIDVRTSQQGRAFADAAIKNHVAQMSGTDEEKANAEAELKNKFDNFVRFSS